MAGEVLAEVKRQRYTYKEIQERADVKARVWNYYFTAQTRSIPFHVLADVCEVLGVKPSEIIARAEATIAAEDARKPEQHPIAAELEAGLSDRDRELLRRLDEEQSRGEGGVDPQGRSRADEDDGIVRSAGRHRRIA